MADPTSAELIKELSALTASVRQLVGANNAEYNAVRKLVDVYDDTNDVLLDYEKQLTNGKELTEDQNKLLQKALAAKRQELELNKRLKAAQENLLRLQEEAKKAGGKDTAQRNLLAKSIKEQRAAITGMKGASAKAAASSVASAAEFAKVMGMAVGALKIFTSVLGFIIGSFLGQYSLQKKQMVANQGFVEGTDALTGMMKQQEQAIAMGIEPEEFAKITTGARQMVNALGGTTKYTELLGEAQNDLYAQTGSFSAALQAATEIAQSMIYSGFKPTKEGVKEYAEDLKNLSRLTGKTITEMQGMVDEVAKDVDSLTLLRAAREDEREAILKSQRAIIEMGVQMGMSAEQAKEAAKMLNKMVAAKPIDRIKQAAKMRAFGAAFGIAGANEAAQGVIAGPRASAEQKKSIQQFNIAATNFADSARGAGLGTEIAVTTLLDKLDLDQYYGSGSNFSATLGTALTQNADEIAKRYTDISKDGFATIVRAEEYWKNAAEWALMNGGWLAIIANHLKDVKQIVSGMWEGFKGAWGIYIDMWKTAWDGLKLMFYGFMEMLGNVLSHVPLLGDAGEALAAKGAAGANEAKAHIATRLESYNTKSISPEQEKLEKQLKGGQQASLDAEDRASALKAKQAFTQSTEGTEELVKAFKENTDVAKEGNKLTEKSIKIQEASEEKIRDALAEGERMGKQKVGGTSYHDLIR